MVATAFATTTAYSARAFLLTSLLLATAGCVAEHRSPAWERPGLAFGALGDTVVDGLISEGDRDYDARATPDRLDEALKAYRAALRYRPYDAQIHVRLARCAIARAASQGGGDAADRLDEAVHHAEQALVARNFPLSEKAKGKESPSAVFAAAELDDLPALSAYAEALFAWADHYGANTLVEQAPQIRAAATRAIALDRHYDHGAADRVLGSLDASLPKSAGADLTSALAHFEAALASAPDYLPTRVWFAERYALRLHDRERFLRLLREVLAADPKRPPESLPENRGAQDRARKLLPHG